MFLGYTSVKTNFISHTSLPGMGRLVLNLALPALIFITISKLDFKDIVEVKYLVIYGLASALTLILGVLFMRLVRQANLVTSGVMGLGMSLSNSAFIGFPVLLQVFDNPPVQAFAMSLMVENILIMPLSLLIIEYATQNKTSTKVNIGHKIKDIFKKVVRNPLLIAIAASMLVALVNIPLPGAVTKSLDLLAAAAIAVALFTIGGSLVGNPIKGDFTTLTCVVVGKLVLHPALVILFLFLIPGLNTDLRLAMLIFAVMPMLSVFPIIASNYNLGKISANILLFTTLLSFIPLTLLLIWYT